MRMVKVEIAAKDDSCFMEGYINLRHVVAFRRHIDDCNKTIVYFTDKVLIIQMRFEDFKKAMLSYMEE